MTDELKPCPFCGGEAEFNSDEFGVGVCCKTCGAVLRNGEYGRYMASADWNTRPIEDAQAAEIKRLREALELIAKSNFYFARGEEDKQLRRVCEIAKDVLKGNENMTGRFKIRVWDKEFNQYWTDEEIKENAAWLLFPDNDNIENIEIEQCTGLKDKNGNLIYEGDILQDCEQRIRVVFDEQRYCFMFEYQNTRAYKPITCIDVLNSELEVIGKIHENKELLK